MHAPWEGKCLFKYISIRDLMCSRFLEPSLAFIEEKTQIILQLHYSILLSNFPEVFEKMQKVECAAEARCLMITLVPSLSLRLQRVAG